MRKKIKVWSSNGQSLIILIEFHQAHEESQLKMSPDKFYKQWREDKSCPKFPHYEMEVIDFEVFGSARFRADYSANQSKLHIHYEEKNPDEKKVFQYVCWTGNVSQLRDAKLI